MGAEDTQIVCRKCNETIALEAGSCPKCGTKIRGKIPYIAGGVFGAVLVVIAVLNLDDLLAFGVFGLLFAAGSVFFLYEKRKRIAQASE